MRTITVYTQRSCMPCALTKRKLADLGLPFSERSAAEMSDVTLVQALDLGAEQTAPLVLIQGGRTLVAAWGGYRPDLIDELAAHVQPQPAA